MRTPIAILIFAAVTLAFFHDVLLGPRVFLDTNPYDYDPWRVYGTPEDLANRTYRPDALGAYLPRRVELTRSIKAGRFPLWNPNIFAGMPFFADPQSRVLYPISLLLVAVDPLKAMGYDAAIHMFIAMLGMYLFLRSIRVGGYAAMLGALAYAFSSFFYVRWSHATFVATAAWIPFFFYGYEKARRSKRWGILALTIFLAMGYLAGFPQVLAFGVGGLVVYALYLGAFDLPGNRKRGLVRSLKILVVSGLLSLLLVGVQLVPFIELARNSTGLGMTLESLREVFLAPPALLVRSLFPNFFGSPVEGTDWSRLAREVFHPYYPDFAVYCGAATLLAALGGLVFWGQSRRIRIFFIFTLLSLGIATSPQLFKVVYYLLPIFRVTRVSRISVLGCFGLSAMAGLGLSLALESTRPGIRKRFILVVAGVVLAVALVSLGFLTLGDSMIGGLLERARSQPESTWLKTLALRSTQIKDWTQGDGAEWWAYEKRQILKGLALFLAGGMLLAVCVWPRRKRALIGTGAALALVVLVGLDAGLVARGYFVSRPSDCLFETPGISFLKEALRDDGRWRVRNLSYEQEDVKVLPPNVNQIYGIPTLSGRSTIIPQGYSQLFEASEDAPLPPQLVGRETNLAPLAIMLSDLASVRYILAGCYGAPYMASPLMGMVGSGQEGICQLRLLSVGGETRPAICQTLNEPIGMEIDVPAVRWLDFSIGFESDAGRPGDFLVFLLRYEGQAGRAEFQHELDLFSERGRWHDFRLDISEVSGGPATIWMVIAAPEDAATPSVTAGWSDLDLVYRDCAVTTTGDIHYLDVGDQGSYLRLTLRSPAREIPLEVFLSDWHRRIHWIGFPPTMPTRKVTIDVGERTTQLVAVRSDSSFSLEACKLVEGGHAYTGLELVHDSDMYIYENLAAVEKGVCVDRRYAVMDSSQGSPVVRIAHPGQIADITRGRCRVVSYRPEQVELEASAELDCFLLFQDIFYPGWKAEVDGRKASIIRTDSGLRAVPIRKGDHRVVMRYSPRSLKVGLAVSCLGLLLTVLYARQQVMKTPSKGGSHVAGPAPDP